MKRLRGGLVFKAHRLLYHSTLGLGVIQKVVARAEALLPADWDAQAVANLLAGYPPINTHGKVDARLPGKGNSNSHGARPVY